jgi:hypothetical protein
MTTTLKEGTIVQPKPNDPVGVRVCADAIAESLGFTSELADVGWQVAEFNGSKARILVRVVDPDGFVVAAWGARGVHVEIASIETSARENPDGRWGVVAEIGDIKATKWVARRDQTVTVG